MTDAKQLGRDTGLLLNGNSAGSPSNNIEDLVVQEILSTNTYPFYVASDIKRSRLTKAEMEVIRAAITDILSKDNPQTVRQVFYALTVRGVIAKAKIEYQRTVVRLLSEMRGAGDSKSWTCASPTPTRCRSSGNSRPRTPTSATAIPNLNDEIPF
jgi:hypothetical protein